LGNDGKGRVQAEVNDWIVDQFRERTGAITDMKMADAEMQKILPEVVIDAQKQAARVTLRVAKESQTAERTAKTAEVAKRIKFLTNAPALGFSSIDQRYTSTSKDGAGNVRDVTKEIYAPAEGTDLAKQLTLPPAERDVVAVSLDRGFWSKSRLVPVDLNAVAKDIIQTDDASKAEKAMQVYIEGKRQLGFTPEEVLKPARITKHGVPFDPKEIDPRHYPVFGSLAKLEEAWNNGKPTALFYQFKAAVAEPNPKKPMSAADFYTAQFVRLKYRH